MKSLFLLLLNVLFLSLHIQTLAQFWTYQPSGTTQHLNGVYMLDLQNGWICGDAGILLKTTNGGQNWTQVSVTGNDLNSVVFKNSFIGVAVGDNGVIIRTTNGGANWNTAESGTTEQFRKISFGSGNTFYAAGDNGLAAVSTNNGETWSLKNSGTTLRFRAVSSPGSNKVWAVGESGLIKYSSDAGSNWSVQTSGVTNELQDIQFVNENIGFAGGSSSKFIFTSDGGQTWTLRNSGIFMDLYGIYFQDTEIGWAVSIAGTIFFTTNGGITWTSQPCGSAFTLREAHFLYQGRGWTVGDNGTIAMYNNPNFPLPVELISFSAAVIQNNVKLSWGTSTEINNQGFEIERQALNQYSSTANSDFVKIGFVQGNGTTSENHSYSFDDKHLSPNKYSYRLKQIDFDGTYIYYNLASEIVIEQPQNFSLSQNYPNPFNPSTKISWHSPVDAWQTLKVYDILGNEIAVLVDGFKPAGFYEVEFSASSGQASGIYFYKFQARNPESSSGQVFAEMRKMILTK